MKQYRGYYIDRVNFHSTSDIDDFIKDLAISRLTVYCHAFHLNRTTEAALILSDHEDWMVRNCGMTPAEVEDIEIAAFEAIAELECAQAN